VIFQSPHSSVIPTGVADFFLRSRFANVGHAAEGPWQHLSLTLYIGTTTRLNLHPGEGRHKRPTRDSHFSFLEGGCRGTDGKYPPP
jgi:hypothetical protein